MSLEVICDYKESLPVASGGDQPNFLKELTIMKNTNACLRDQLSLIINEVKILKKEMVSVKAMIVENLAITKSLHVEIVSLIQAPPPLEDDVDETDD